MTGKAQLRTILRGYRQPLIEDPHKKYYRDAAKKKSPDVMVWLLVLGMASVVVVAALFGAVELMR